jgi:hypothetical protein
MRLRSVCADAAGCRQHAFVHHVSRDSSDEVNPMVCPLPVTITRVFLAFYERSRPAQALLTQEVAATYIFSTP